jgi:hypothetical protein
MRDLDLNADYINVSDITDRVEELREERDGLQSNIDEAEEALNEGDEPGNWNLEARTNAKLDWIIEYGEELATLEALLDELAGYGGDHQWEGDWYPATLIRDSYFTEAMKELCEDIGDFPNGLPGYYVIDWDATADNLRVDYSSVTVDGVEYWYR